jgi:hypothetical protein
LTSAQAQRRVDSCRRLLQNPHDERFVRRIVTCVEKWVYFMYRQTKSMVLSLSSGETSGQTR